MVDGSSPSASRDRDRPSNPNAKVDAGEESATSRTARQLLDGIRRDQPGEPHLQTLETIDDHGLDRVRNDRRTAMAFWLNVYNAAAQRLLDRRPNLFESRWRFFRAPAVTIAGIDLSLDDIEHGIMRGNRSKYGLGYLPRLRRTGLGPDVGLSADPRIHFALNCGAASCPAIRSFHPQTVHRTLDAATDASLQETLAYDADRGLVHVPRVCLWFIGDFGAWEDSDRSCDTTANSRRHRSHPSGSDTTTGPKHPVSSSPTASAWPKHGRRVLSETDGDKPALGPTGQGGDRR